MTNTTYTHTPRPAIVPEAPAHQWQRRFGQRSEACGQRLQADTDSLHCNMVAVFRNGHEDVAELQVNIGLHTNARITMRMLPTELRALAASLIDAAADIEAHPAAERLAAMAVEVAA